MASKKVKQFYAVKGMGVFRQWNSAKQYKYRVFFDLEEAKQWLHYEQCSKFFM